MVKLTKRAVEAADAGETEYFLWDEELKGFYETRKYPWLIRFTYNLALTKRVNRKLLLEEVGLKGSSTGDYWGFFQISKDQLRQVLKLSGDYEKARSLVYSS